MTTWPESHTLAHAHKHTHASAPPACMQATAHTRKLRFGKFSLEPEPLMMSSRLRTSRFWSKFSECIKTKNGVPANFNFVDALIKCCIESQKRHCAKNEYIGCAHQFYTLWIWKIKMLRCQTKIASFVPKTMSFDFLLKNIILNSKATWISQNKAATLFGQEKCISLLATFFSLT